MLSFLVCYGTGEGQTAKITDRIGDALTARGHDATTVDASELPSDLEPGTFDAVLVGASVHAGKQQPTVREFVRTNRDVLNAMPTAFFQVSLSSAEEQGAEQAASYVETFLEETDWHPDRIGYFGGALRYSEYGFLKRQLMKLITSRTISEMPGADDAGDVEFTDWAAVDAFAADVASFVEGRLGVTPPEPDGENPSV